MDDEEISQKIHLWSDVLETAAVVFRQPFSVGFGSSASKELTESKVNYSDFSGPLFDHDLMRMRTPNTHGVSCQTL